MIVSGQRGVSVSMWEPGTQELEASNIAQFLAWLRSTGRADLADYEQLHAWSVTELEAFWHAVWDHANIRTDVPPNRVLASSEMPGTEWFPGTNLNYAEQVFASEGAGTAFIAVTETSSTVWSWDRVHDEVAALTHHLREQVGVRPGDRVVGYLPNGAEALIAFLATAAIGAVWAVCNPDLSARSVLDRLAQLEPTVLVASESHRYAGKLHDRRAAVAEIQEGLPTLREVIVVPSAVTPWRSSPSISSWTEATSQPAELTFHRVPFDHPLWVLFSSGTTGTPKGIVHGHGGVVLEHHKYLALQFDLGPGDRYFWFATTSWVMWNLQVSGLLVGATIVLYDGSPTFGGSDRLWEVVEEQQVTVFGTSAGYLLTCAKEGSRPGRTRDLGSLRILGSTGSPLPASGYEWVRDAVSDDLPVISTSGGTDVATAFVGGSPLTPVVAGEISVSCLGAAVEAWDEHGRAVVDEVGELVVTRPMPSMPVAFWADPDGSRYRAAYFDTYPGVWRQGDWVTLTARGTVIVHGRSDATLNRMGVRLGSAEIYQAIEHLAEIHESLVVGVERPDGGYWLPLFVQLADGGEVNEQLERTVSDAIRRAASPRHVPDEIIAVSAIPHTLTGKKLEIPIKRILQGADPREVLNLGSVDQPGLIDEFVRLAEARGLRAEVAG